MAATKKRGSGTMNSVGKKVKSAAKTVAKKAGKVVKSAERAMGMGGKKKTTTKKKTAKSGSR